MTTKDAQILFSKTVKGDSVLQLKNGNILFYFFRSDYSISIYNEKSFQKIFSINIYKTIKKYENGNEEEGKEKSKEKKDSNDDEDEEEKERRDSFRKRFLYEDKKDLKRKNSVKELNSGIILIGRDNYLIELKLSEKEYETKVISKLNDIILDINELPDERILVITEKNITIFNRENGEYLIKKEYPIKDSWKIVPVSSTERFFGNFHQYFSSELLPNDRLLLKSFSTELFYNYGCGTHPPCEFSHTNIIFLETKNFEEIKKTELFKSDAKYIIFDNIIAIQNSSDLLMYDINSLELIKKTELFESLHYIYKFDDQYLITLSEDEERNMLLVYKKENNDIIGFCRFRTKVSFEKIFGWNSYPIKNFNNKNLFTLKDKRVVVLCHDKMYALQLDLE